jgi:N-dimethylarginine dimethylaminohydrolase
MRHGGHSNVWPLRDVLVKVPGPAFGGAFDDPRHGFLHPVDLEEARRQHDAFCVLLADLGVRVHELGEETESPDLVYQYDPSVVTDRGVILLRSGKPTRRGEEAAVERWAAGHGIPVAGRIEAPGTVDGGDAFWLGADAFCVGRSLRTNAEGVRQLATSMARTGAQVHVFDVPYDRGPAVCLHLMSVISPVADDLAVVFLPMLPSGLYELLRERGVDLVAVPEQEMATLGCNVLAVKPRVVVMVQGNPVTRRALEERACEVHTFEGSEVCVNGGGGPTCLTRPILREATILPG